MIEIVPSPFISAALTASPESFEEPIMCFITARRSAVVIAPFMSASPATYPASGAVLITGSFEGLGDGDGLGDGEGDGLGEGDGEGLGDDDGLGEGDGEGLGAGSVF